MESMMAGCGMVALHGPHISRSRVEAPPGGRPSVVILERNDCRNAHRPVLLLEVGLRNVTWWNKAHQALLHLVDMINIRLSAPALMAVLTIEPTESNEFKSGRLGVFLVTPKTTAAADGDGNDDFRLCLLSRFETSHESRNASTPEERLSQLSHAFGRLLRASCKLPTLYGAATGIDFEYLGPNCSRIGDKVLRSFDSRFHLPDRRPDVYLRSGVVENVKVVFLKSDARFVDRPEKCNEREWLWKFHGRLLTLSVPFYEGRHWAKSLSEYVPLVRKLMALHEAGYVHGDIRCFNIIFSKEDSYFIDYDLGGEIDDKGDGPAFPPGYAFNLDDGIRQGTVGVPIRDVHDWSALFFALFNSHRVKPPPGSADKYANALASFSLDIPDELCKRPDTKDAAIAKLEEFLDDVKKAIGWHIDVSSKLESALMEAGLGMRVSPPVMCTPETPKG